MAEIINPKNKDPQSPIKILAGWALQAKKPNVPDARIKAILNKSKRLSIIAIEPMTTSTITLMPPAKPSNPSIKLTALVIPATQIIVKTNEIIPVSICIPKGKRIISTEIPK